MQNRNSSRVAQNIDHSDQMDLDVWQRNVQLNTYRVSNASENPLARELNGNRAQDEQRSSVDEED